jgi:hypothetical protein
LNQDEEAHEEKTCYLSWQDLKKYLEYVDEDTTTCQHVHNEICNHDENEKQNGLFAENEEIQNDDLFDEFYSGLIDDTAAHASELVNKAGASEKKKEQNEYDFANSLLTIEYKPYNQYSMNFNYKNLYLSQHSLLTRVSLTSSSVGNYYKTMNRLKFQSNLTDKLVQINEFNFEETLKKLLNTYTAIMPHLLYSLLKGKPVICVARSCSDLAYLESVVDCLSNFLPNSFYCLNSLTNKRSFVQASNDTSGEQCGGDDDDDDDENLPKFTSSPCNNQFDSASSMQQQQQQQQQRSESIFNNQEFTSPNGQVMPQLRVMCERKQIKLNDLKYCKLFGLCLMISKDGCCSNDCHNNVNNNGTNGESNGHGVKSIRQHKHKHYHMSKEKNLLAILKKLNNRVKIDFF